MKFWTSFLQNEPDAEKPPTDDFEDFRLECADLVKEFAKLVGPENLFDLMCATLKAEQQDISWDRLEALLWILAAIIPILGDNCQTVPGKKP